MQKIILATSNKGKIADFQHLNSSRLKLIPQKELNITDTPETGLSFIENAILKARGASKQANMPAIADDSGLAVDYLAGAPGIYSARYAGIDANADDNIDKLLSNIQGVPDIDRVARFYCVIAFVQNHNDPTPIIAQGIWQGRIADKRYGNNGFGYDAIFCPDGYTISAAQMDIKLKNTISHRYIALQKIFKLIKI